MSGPCEYESVAARAAFEDEVHAVAEVILGHDGQWRLCCACAERPDFARFRLAYWIGDIATCCGVRPVLRRAIPSPRGWVAQCRRCTATGPASGSIAQAVEAWSRGERIERGAP